MTIEPTKPTHVNSSLKTLIIATKNLKNVGTRQNCVYYTQLAAAEAGMCPHQGSQQEHNNEQRMNH
jgi:hypothetical protein